MEVLSACSDLVIRNQKLRGKELDAFMNGVHLMQGRLSYAIPERKLLYRAGLERRFANATRPKADAPQKAQRDDKAAEWVNVAHEQHLAEPPSPPEIATTYWERLDQKLQLVLDAAPAYWAEAPNPQRLRLFVRSLDELRSQVEAEGLNP